MGLWVLQGGELHDVDVRQNGGALALWGSSSSASLTQCCITNNTALFFSHASFPICLFFPESMPAMLDCRLKWEQVQSLSVLSRLLFL